MGAEEDLERPRAGRLLGVGDVERGDELAWPHGGVQVDLAAYGCHHQRRLLACLDRCVLTCEHEERAACSHVVRVRSERDAACARVDVHQRVACLVADSSCAARLYDPRLESERGSVDRPDVEGRAHERRA